MNGWLNSADSGTLTWMRSSATSTAWMNQHQLRRRRGDSDDLSRTIHTGSRQRGRNTEGGRKVDTDSGQRTAAPTGKSVAGADGPGASARVGALCDRREPGYAGHGEAH